MTPATTNKSRTKKTADDADLDVKVEVEEKAAPKTAAKRAAAKRAPVKKKKADDVVEEDEAPVAGAVDDDEDDDAKPKFTEPLPTGAIVISSNDDEDVPVYSTQITGATADPVKDYLKQIGKVALLNAAEAVSYTHLTLPTILRV